MIIVPIKPAHPEEICTTFPPAASRIRPPRATQASQVETEQGAGPLRTIVQPNKATGWSDHPLMTRKTRPVAGSYRNSMVL